MGEKLVLAYSGGLDTSVAVRWLKEERGFEVIAITADVGMQRDREEVQSRGPATRGPPRWPRRSRARLSPANWWRRRGPKAPPPSPTAAPARGTTRCGWGPACRRWGRSCAWSRPCAAGP